MDRLVLCISSNPAFILIPFSPLLRQIISPRTTVHLVSPLQLVKQRGKSVKNQSACIKGPCWLCIGVAYGMSGFPFCICDSIVPVHVHPAFCVGRLKLKVEKRKATQEIGITMSYFPMLDLRFEVGLPPPVNGFLVDISSIQSK